LGSDEFRVLVRWLIEGTKGGRVRALILLELRRNPSNPHRLSRVLGLNYRTITHHLEVLERHGIVRRLANGYGAPYVLTELAASRWSVIEESIKRRLGGEV